MLKKIININLNQVYSRYEAVLGAIMLIIFSGGVIAHTSEKLYAFSVQTTEILLYAVGLIVLVIVFKRNHGLKIIFLSTGTLLFTFVMEATGVHTGDFFGHYSYGSIFSVKVLDVPIIITINWLVLILSVNEMMAGFTRKTLLHGLLVAIVIVFFDFIMEPVAMHLGYWNWMGGVIPLQNYMAWFVIALIPSLLYHYFKIRINSIALKAYFISQFIFFLLLNVHIHI